MENPTLALLDWIMVLNIEPLMQSILAGNKSKTFFHGCIFYKFKTDLKDKINFTIFIIQIKWVWCNQLPY